MSDFTVELAAIDLPDFGLPAESPQVPASEYAARLAEARRRAAARGLDVLIVYGDREHFANLAFLTGYDPRFEESLLVVVSRAPDFAGSTIPLRSGMALQCDVIPATGGPYFTTNIEDTVALANEALRAELATRYPQMWRRIQQ